MNNIKFGVTCYAGNAIIKINAKILKGSVDHLRYEYKTMIIKSIGKGLTRFEGVLPISEYHSFKDELDRAIIDRKIEELKHQKTMIGPLAPFVDTELPF